MGWFEHGSTIVVLAPGTLSLADNVQTGTVIRQGQPLLRLQQRLIVGARPELMRTGTGRRFGAGSASRLRR